MKNKRRTGKRWLAGLLSIVLALCLLPGAALAEEGDSRHPEVQFTIVKKVVKAENAATPPAETFEFELEDTADEKKTPAAYGIELDELKIETNGADDYVKTVKARIDMAKVNPNGGWESIIPEGSQDPSSYYKTFHITEKNDGKDGWKYSTAKYAVTFKYDREARNMTCGVYEIGNDVSFRSADFTNTYTKQAPSTKTVEIPFTKVVTLGGNVAPGKQTFELEIFEIGNSNANEYSDVTYTASVETNGVKNYESKLVITGPENQLEQFTCEGFYVREKNAGAANWTYSDAVWYVSPNTNGGYDICPAELKTSDNGDYYDPDRENAAEKMTFTNTYTYNTSSGSDSSSGATITVNKTDALGTPLSGAVFVLESSRGRESYTATSNARGIARFTDVDSGTYTLREKSAPAGYVASDETYELTVGGTRVTMGSKSYSPVTFVNRKAAELNRIDHFAFLIGYQDGTFGPERNMTRAEVTTMFTRLLTERIDADKTYPNTFSDVPAGYWAANYIGYAQQFGIVMGFDDGSFRPDAPVTRAQFAATRGWVTGYADGTFKPENHITRAEVAAVTCRLLERSADQSYIRNHLNTLPRTFTDMTESHWAYWYALEAANGHDYTRSSSSETWARTYQ